MSLNPVAGRLVSRGGTSGRRSRETVLVQVQLERSSQGLFHLHAKDVGPPAARPEVLVDLDSSFPAPPVDNERQVRDQRN